MLDSHLLRRWHRSRGAPSWPCPSARAASSRSSPRCPARPHCRCRQNLPTVCISIHYSSSLIRSSLAAFLLLLPREPLSESKILLVSSFSLSISNISNNSIFKNKTVIKISPFAWQEKQLSSQPHVPCVGANHDRKSSLHLKVLLDGRIPSG